MSTGAGKPPRKSSILSLFNPFKSGSASSQEDQRKDSAVSGSSSSPEPLVQERSYYDIGRPGEESEAMRDAIAAWNRTQEKLLTQMSKDLPRYLTCIRIYQLSLEASSSSPSTSTSSSLSSPLVYRPSNNCRADTEQELSFEKGDLLTILEKTYPTWWLARLNEQQGFVPVNFLACENVVPLDLESDISSPKGRLVLDAPKFEGSTDARIVWLQKLLFLLSRFLQNMSTPSSPCLTCSLLLCSCLPDGFESSLEFKSANDLQLCCSLILERLASTDSALVRVLRTITQGHFSGLASSIQTAICYDNILTAVSHDIDLIFHQAHLEIIHTRLETAH